MSTWKIAIVGFLGLSACAHGTEPAVDTGIRLDEAALRKFVDEDSTSFDAKRRSVVISGTSSIDVSRIGVDAEVADSTNESVSSTGRGSSAQSSTSDEGGFSMSLTHSGGGVVEGLSDGAGPEMDWDSGELDIGIGFD